MRSGKRLMKRLGIAFILTLLPTAVFALDVRQRPVRIGILVPADDVQSAVAAALVDELRDRGEDAYESHLTYDDAWRDGAGDADYLVEIIGGDAHAADYGGLGIGGRHADVTVGVVSTRVAAELRLYDAETMELLASEPLSKKSTAVLPTGFGVGGRAIYTWIAFPLAERVQARKVARAAAREAAALVVETIRGR